MTPPPNAFTTRVQAVLNRTGLRKKEKVFAIGFNKSGTTSLHTLFKSLGLSSYHGVEWRPCDDLDLLRKYDCFSDGIPANVPRLDDWFPGAKYILQVRELGPWVLSRLAHIERSKARGTHRAKPTWDTTEEAVCSWIRERNEHHLHVLSYFAERPSDLLVVNYIRDDAAATKICAFLGYGGTHTRPRKNVKPGKEHDRRHLDLLRRCATTLGVGEEELGWDILVGSMIASPNAFPVDTSLLPPEPSSA
jgi:hypothetical protein